MSRSKLPLIVLAGALAPFAAQGGDVRFWLEDSLVKVFPDSTPAARSGLEVLLPRNGHGSLQAAVRSAGGLEGLTLELVSRTGGVPQVAAELRRVGFVPVRNKPPKTEDGELARVAPGEFPDPLHPAAPFDLVAGRSQPFWITLHAPLAAKPGAYRFRLVLRQGPKQLGRLDFRAVVTRAEVPAKQTLRVTNWFTWGDERLQRHYPALAANPEKKWELLENIGRVMAEHRQNVILTPVLSLSDARLENGGIVYDFTRLDRFVETFDRAGMAGTIEGGHLLGRVSGYQTPLAIPCDFIEDGKVARRKLPPEDERVERHLRRFLASLREHLRSRGWLERYAQHIHDEPHGEEIPHYVRFAKVIRESLPGVPTVDAISLREGVDFLKGTLDIWTPVLASFDDQTGVLAQHAAGGGQVWFYTCIFPQGPYLNRFIDYPLLKTRLLHWLNYRHNLSGFLHWGGNYWSDEPFKNVEPIINDGRTLLPAGDNAIVYPDPERLTVLSSIRLEAMREGIEDYELLKALAARNPAAADAMAREAIPNFTDYVRDVAAFRRLHRRLLESFR
jgi:hypothetical protein